MTASGNGGVRNIAFCGHGAAGKTTLVDALLHVTGMVKDRPSVDAGTSICDFDAEEKAHRYSIESSVVHCTHNGCRLNLIDTPGYPDFIGQTIAALRAVESAAICVNGHTGIQINTRRVFQEAEKAHLGRMIILTKMDDEHADFDQLIEQLRKTWGSAVVPMQIPRGQGHSFKGVVDLLKVQDNPPADAVSNVGTARERLIESIVEVDETVMERYFGGEIPSEEELLELLPRSVAAGSLIPVFCVAAKAEIGLKELLDGLLRCAPRPAQVERLARRNGETIRLTDDPQGPLVAQVFRTRIDPFVQKLSYLRIYSGQIHKDDSVHASNVRKNIKLGPILEMQGGQTQAVDGAKAGDIVALAKIEELHTGTSLGEAEMPPVEFPRPMVGLAVAPKTRGDENKLSSTLHKVLEEDPTFRLAIDPQTSEMVMTGMSELHLQVIQQRISRRDKLDVVTHDPKIPYHETIQTAAEGSYRHKKQTGGRGQFGEVHIRMIPLPRDTNISTFATKARFPSMKETHYDAEHNFLWVDSVVGGTIPGNFMPAVEKGFKERLVKGVLAGYPIQDVCVEVHFGKHHPVDSSEAAFKTAASMAFRDVFRSAKPCLLEPVVKMDITVPENFVGDVYGDMSSRGGRVLGSDSAGGNLQVIHCEVPLRCVAHYSRTISSMTGGQGSYTMDFAHYEAMPANVQQEVVSTAKLPHEEEEAS